MPKKKQNNQMAAVRDAITGLRALLKTPGAVQSPLLTRELEVLERRLLEELYQQTVPTKQGATS